MKPAFTVLILALACAFASAASTQQQEQTISVNATEAPALVEVRGSLDFAYFVPGVENRENITIALALSQMSVSTIAAGDLKVYVLIEPKRNDSLLYFAGNPEAKSYYLTLDCIVGGQSCAQGSVTERTVGVYFNSSSPGPLEGDGIIVRAAVVPFVPEQENQSEFAPNSSSVGLEARIMQAASGVLGIVGQAANVTTGALSDISITVTTNNTSASPATVLPDSSYDSAAPAQDLSSAIGMFLGEISKPEVATVVCLLAVGALIFLRLKGRKRRPNGPDGIFDF